MCIRDRLLAAVPAVVEGPDLVVGDAAEDVVSIGVPVHGRACLLYTSDAADERSSVDLGGRRIIKEKVQFHIRRLGVG